MSINLLYLRDNRSQGVPGLAHEQHTLLNLIGRRSDQHLNLLCCVCRTLGKLANLLSDDSKTFACVSGPCSLYARIEGQQICLERYVINHRDDGAYCV